MSTLKGLPATPPSAQMPLSPTPQSNVIGQHLTLSGITVTSSPPNSHPHHQVVTSIVPTPVAVVATANSLRLVSS